MSDLSKSAQSSNARLLMCWPSSAAKTGLLLMSQRHTAAPLRKEGRRISAGVRRESGKADIDTEAAPGPSEGPRPRKLQSAPHPTQGPLLPEAGSVRASRVNSRTDRRRASASSSDIFPFCSGAGSRRILAILDLDWIIAAPMAEDIAAPTKQARTETQRLSSRFKQPPL